MPIGSPEYILYRLVAQQSADDCINGGDELGAASRSELSIMSVCDQPLMCSRMMRMSHRDSDSS